MNVVHRDQPRRYSQYQARVNRMLIELPGLHSKRSKTYPSSTDTAILPECPRLPESPRTAPSGQELVTKWIYKTTEPEQPKPEIEDKWCEWPVSIKKSALLSPGMLVDISSSIKSGNFKASMSMVGVTTTEQFPIAHAMGILNVKPENDKILLNTVTIEAELSHGEISKSLEKQTYTINHKRDYYTFWIDLVSKEELENIDEEELTFIFEITLTTM